jgi:2-keto-4-pentenoate hydratase/2-oxohepta-3-ene-1,7-dioic acid hydratase in catechol pathway
MKFATVSTLRATSQPALVLEDRVQTLPYPDMLAVIAAGAEKAARRASKEALTFEEISFLSPLKPTTLRDGYAFEQHVVTANKNRGREVPEEWYQFPVFYFTNPNAVFGHEDVIPYPPYTSAMDYEL